MVHIIDTTGQYYYQKLGSNLEKDETFQFIVRAGSWFASEPAPGSLFCLAGCTVAPGFDFADFEIADKEYLLNNYPQHANIIDRLSR